MGLRDTIANSAPAQAASAVVHSKPAKVVGGIAKGVGKVGVVAGAVMVLAPVGAGLFLGNKLHNSLEMGMYDWAEGFYDVIRMGMTSNDIWSNLQRAGASRGFAEIAAKEKAWNRSRGEGLAGLGHAIGTSMADWQMDMT